MTVDASSIVSTEDMARRLREVLATLNVSQAEFARRVGVSKAFVSAVANDKSQPSIQMIGGMRASYGISADWFILGSGAMLVEPMPPVTPARRPPRSPLQLLIDEILASSDDRDLRRLERLLRAFRDPEEVPARTRA